MKPAAFEYVRAETADHAVELLARYGDDARLLAGGQTLVPMMNLRLVRAELLIDIGRLPLAEVDASAGSIVLGALARHRNVLEHPQIAASAPVISDAMRHLAHPTIRNHGTAGGSIAYADSTAELCAMLVLLDGEVTARSVGLIRTIAVADFFLGAFTTALRQDEMIVSLRFKPPARKHGWCFLEMSERLGDYAIAAVGAVLAVEAGIVTYARIVLSGAEATPVRAGVAEGMLLGQRLTDELAREAAASAVAGHDAYSDIRASADYRRRLLERLTFKAVTTSYERA